MSNKTLESVKNRNIVISYCVLHYNNIDVTKQCINSILISNNGDLPYYIVVVDNGSTNNSGKLVERLYSDNERVKIIINDKNEGFARGNNIAYNYSRNTLGASILIVMNSDIIIDESFSYDCIVQANEKYKSDIMSPDVINKIGNHQVPLALRSPTFLEHISAYVKNFIVSRYIYIPIIGESIYRIYINRYNRRKRKVVSQVPFNHKDFIPHGSCIIYSNNWIMNEDFAFVPETFLFAEEEYLYEYMKMKGYSIQYAPELYVSHLCEGTINYEYNDGRRRLFFMYSQMNKSLRKVMRFRIRNKLY